MTPDVNGAGYSHVAFDSAGDAMIVWAEQRSSDWRAQIKAAWRPANGDFGAPETVSSPATTAADAHVAFDPGGGALVTWFSSADQLSFEGRAAYRPKDGNFEAPTTLGSAPFYAGNLAPASGFDERGKAVIAWASAIDDTHVVVRAGRFRGPNTVPDDSTPPAISPNLEGSKGNGDWYTSDVHVSWSVSDPQSDVSAKDGCDDVSVTEDMAGKTITCTATSAGGTASQSVTVKRDATNPTMTLTGGGNYTVSDTVTISCSSSDATSGVASDTCATTASTRPAYDYALGSTPISAHASDHAGNTGSADTSVTVSVTTASLKTLTARWTENAGIAHALAEKLDRAADASTRGDEQAADAAITAFNNQLSAQSGKAISAEHATLLARLSQSL